MKHMKTKLLATAALIALAMPTHAAEGKLKVVASFSILADIAQAIGGELVEVTSVAEAGDDMHGFKMTPSHLKAASEADLLILNGLTFDSQVAALENELPEGAMVIVASDGVDLLKARIGGEGDDHDDHDDHKDDHDDHKDEDHSEGEHEEHGEDAHKDDHDDHDNHDDHDDHKDDGHDGHGHHGEFDPHAWMSIENAEEYVDNIADAIAAAAKARLTDLSDADLAALDARAETYEDALEELDDLAEDIEDDLEDADAFLAVAHDGFAYFMEMLDVDYIAYGDGHHGEELSAQVRAELPELLSAHKTAIIFEALGEHNHIADELSASTGAVLAPPLISDGLLADHPASSFLGFLEYNLKTVQGALAKK